jgi:hypothetical protein
VSEEGGKKALTSLMLDLLGPAAKEVGATLGDHVRYYRWRSGVWIMNRAKEKVKARGEKLGSAPLKFLVPFLEKASLEDEGSKLSERWAELLAKAATSYDSSYSKYIDTLAKLDGEDCVILEEIYISIPDVFYFGADNFSQPTWIEEITPKGLQKVTGIIRKPQDWSKAGRLVVALEEKDVPNFQALNMEEFEPGVRLLNLASMGLIWVYSNVHITSNDNVSDRRYFIMLAELTPLGFNFVKACTDDEGAP